MKTYVATVEVEFTCLEEGMVRDRVIGIPFGDHDCGFRLKKIEKRKLAKGTDETRKLEYRERHGCWPLVLPE